MDFQIQQRVALVCGAGSGLGQAIALSLAQEGVKVAVTGRSAENWRKRWNVSPYWAVLPAPGGWISPPRSSLIE